MLKKTGLFLLKFAPKLKSVSFILLIVIFILLNIAIWWMGPWLIIANHPPLMSLYSRLIASVILTLLFISLWGIIQWRQLKAYRKLQQKQQWLVDDPILRFEDQQQQSLDNIIHSMKKNYIKRNYLYALPWYIIMGNAQAGKTSLIQRSGQSFAFSSVLQANRTNKNTPYGFGWWISDTAVLIDPDGELLMQQEQPDFPPQLTQRLWLHFIKWLDKTRTRRPLNGVVLVIDIAELAQASNSQRILQAETLRNRLRELMEQLATRLPVYIVLTKLDLLYGFEAFFRHYTRAEREEVLGFTFSLDSINQLDQWLSEFDQSYQAMIKRINTLLPNALMQSFDEQERRDIYSFSRQLAGLHPILMQFLHDMLSSDQFSTSALVRGLYLTSVYQQGVPTDIFVNVAATRYHLPNKVNFAQDGSNSTSYFVQNLFKKIIYPEAGLATDNFRVAKNKRRIFMLSTITCSLASLLVLIGWQHYYDKNAQQAEQVLEQVNHYKDHYAPSIEQSIEQDLLAPLNTIRQATLAFGYFHQKPRFISDMGLYQGHAIGPKVENTYLYLLETRFMPILLKEIAADLANAKTEEQKLAILRVFKMLTDKSGRYRYFVQDYFSKLWQQRYVGNRATQDELNQHLSYIMSNTDLQTKRNQGDAEAELILAPYDQLVKDTQQQLSRIPIEQWVYLSIKQQSNYQLGAALHLNTAIGPVFEMVFEQQPLESSPLQIPKILTKVGYENYFINQVNAVSDLILVDSWVLGQSQSLDFSEADKKALRNKVYALYAADYINSWNNALSHLQLRHFNDLNEALLVIENITGNMQPFNRLLMLLSDNTQLLPPLPNDNKAKEALLSSPNFKTASLIEQQFYELDDLIKNREGEPPYINEVTNAINQLQAYLKAIATAPDIGKAALDATKARVSLSNFDPIYTLQRIATNLPHPMKHLIKDLADQSWYAVRQQAIRHLEIRWRNEVYSEFSQKMLTRYPFNRLATKDVALRDFEQFFSPNKGTFSTFYDNNLKLFLDEGLLNVNNQSSHSLIRQDVLDQIALAQRIQKAFFNNKGSLDISFTIEPLQMSQNKRRSVLNVDGQLIEYSNGPRKATELIWPNTLRESIMSSLTLVPTESNYSPRTLSMQGAWSFFRLLDKSEVTAISPTTVDYKFMLDQGDIRYRIRSESDSNPFTLDLFKNFNLPESLY